jgi:actin-related protein 5
VVVQFPFVVPVTEEKTEEELTRIAERRKEQGKKLQEMAANKRMEKVSPKFIQGQQNYISASAPTKRD